MHARAQRNPPAPRDRHAAISRGNERHFVLSSLIAVKGLIVDRAIVCFVGLQIERANSRMKGSAMGAPELMSSDANVNTDKLTADLRVLISDVEALLSVTAGQAGERIAAVRASAEASLTRARQQLDQVQSMIADKARSAVNAGADYTRSNPWSALGIATAVGVLIGLLIGRR
jgi:ElaB/YqjD/DUF883 family membrane-anchored ribosome-binding protein